MKDSGNKIEVIFQVTNFPEIELLSDELEEELSKWLSEFWGPEYEIKVKWIDYKNFQG